MSDKVKNGTINVSDFHSIVLAGIGNITFTQGDHYFVTLTAEPHVHDALEFTVEDGVLRIATKEGIRKLNTQEPISYHITAPELRAVKIAGSGSFTAETISGTAFTLDTPGSAKINVDTLDMTSIGINTRGSVKCNIGKIAADVLALDVKGSGSFNLPSVNLQSLSGSFKGSGNIEVIGKAKVITLSSAGTVQFKGAKLASEIATVESPGLGNITVWVTDKLTARISGMGTIRYYGNPQVTKKVTGMGKIKHLGEAPVRVV